MIDFRYHLVSIVAVFFALAVGIVLGAGPLGERVADDLPARFDEMRQQNSDLQNQLLAFQTSQDYQQSFVDGVADELLSDRLTDETVLVVGLPGVDGDRLEQLRDVLARSGASVTGTLRVADSWSEPDSETALDTLAAELTTQPLPTDGDGYVRGASVLANTVLTSLPPEDVPTDPANGLDGVPDPSEWIVEESVLTAFSEAGLIEVNGELSTKANLVLVVAQPTALAEPPEADEDGESSDEGGEPQEWFDKLITLVEMFEQVGRGIVVAGERAAAAEHDVLGIIRGSDGLREEVSTVDSVELATGQVAAVYALVEQSDDGVGHYGLTESADAQSPPVPPRPEPEIDPDEGQPGETDGDTGAETADDGAAESEQAGDDESGDPVGAESGEGEES